MSTKPLESLTILIVEDGDEYLNNLSRFVPGPRYLQAKSGAAAIFTLNSEQVDIVYLDMRFDRIPHGDLEGDHVQATRDCNGDPTRAWKHLQNNQGLYILDSLRRAGYGGVPVVLAYDFSRESRRYKILRQAHPCLSWVRDAVTPAEIRDLLEGISDKANP
jgi:CheY-like chemotaxis protein